MARKILFICKENAGRSQMAEGFARSLAPHLDVISAGTEPSSELNPVVVQAMNEVGIDITRQKPKALTGKMIAESVPVSMGCIDAKSCPAAFVRDMADWQITDPKDADIEQVRKIRDQVRGRVVSLIKELDA